MRAKQTLDGIKMKMHHKDENTRRLLEGLQDLEEIG